MIEINLDRDRNKKLNRLVNILYKMKGENIYFSIKDMKLSEKYNNDYITIKRLPVFDSAEKILTILEENNIDFKEKELIID